MARGFSKVIITGNLTRDPELRTTPNGNTVCSFSVAVNRSFKDANGNTQDSVSFLDCSAWGRGAEIINQYARKGSGILVSGRLEQRSWEDKTTGQKRSKVEIVVEDFNFLGGIDREGASKDYSGEANNAAAAGPEEAADVAPDDIPEEIEMSEIPF